MTYTALRKAQVRATTPIKIEKSEASATIFYASPYAWLSDLELYYLREEAELITADYIYMYTRAYDKGFYRTQYEQDAAHKFCNDTCDKMIHDQVYFCAGIQDELLRRGSEYIETKDIFTDQTFHLPHQRLVSLIARFIDPALGTNFARDTYGDMIENKESAA